MDGSAPEEKLAAKSDQHLRGAPRLMAPERRKSPAHLSRTGRHVAAVRFGDGIYAHRSVADCRASLRRLVGLSSYKLLRAHQPVRPARRPPPFHRQMSSSRNRRDHGLGAGAFSKGRTRARRVRWHPSLRAHGPAPGRATGLGHAHFQFWPQRGAQFSGSTNITSTVFAWTRWLRCSTSITRASPGNGSRTFTAAARTLTRFIFSSVSTKFVTSVFLESSPLPKNQPH